MYSTRGISYFKCYSVTDLSVLLKKSDKTIFKHIKDGLKTIDQRTPFMVRGYDLIAYIKKYNDARKCPTEFHEFYCLACKEARTPRGKEIVVSGDGKIMARAACSSCGKTMHKPYKTTDWPRLKTIFKVVENLSIYDSDNTPLDFHEKQTENTTDNGKQLCLF